MPETMTMDRPTIRKMGYEALTEKLGPIGTVAFMQDYDSGYGDYTKERHQWLDNLSIDDVCNEIKGHAKKTPGTT
jgi:hypothetical protein